MDFANAIAGDRAPLQAAIVNPFLDGDMCFRFELQIALVGIVAIVVLQRALDIDRVSVVPFDQVAVVAVHCAHQIGKRGQQALRQAAAKPGRLLRQLQGKVGQAAAKTRASPISKGSISETSSPRSSCRFNVRFHVLIICYRTSFMSLLRCISSHNMS